MNSGDHGYIKFFHQLHQHDLVGNVQMIGRLIQNQCRGLLGKCSCQDHPLLLSSGKSGKGTVCKRLHLYGFQRFIHDLVIFCIVPFQSLFMRRTPHKNHLADRKIKIIIIVLCHHGHFFRRTSNTHGMKLLAVQIHGSCVWFQNTVNAFQQSGFSASVWSDDSYQFLILGFHGDSLQDLSGVKANLNIFCGDLHYRAPPNP